MQILKMLLYLVGSVILLLLYHIVVTFITTIFGSLLNPYVYIGKIFQNKSEDIQMEFSRDLVDNEYALTSQFTTIYKVLLIFIYIAIIIFGILIMTEIIVNIVIAGITLLFVIVALLELFTIFISRQFNIRWLSTFYGYDIYKTVEAIIAILSNPIVFLFIILFRSGVMYSEAITMALQSVHLGVFLGVFLYGLFIQVFTLIDKKFITWQFWYISLVNYQQPEVAMNIGLDDYDVEKIRLLNTFFPIIYILSLLKIRREKRKT